MAPRSAAPCVRQNKTLLALALADHRNRSGLLADHMTLEGRLGKTLCNGLGSAILRPGQCRGVEENRPTRISVQRISCSGWRERGRKLSMKRIEQTGLWRELAALL
jgi:hypothetical protein